MKYFFYNKHFGYEFLSYYYASCLLPSFDILIYLILPDSDTICNILFLWKHKKFV